MKTYYVKQKQFIIEINSLQQSNQPHLTIKYIQLRSNFLYQNASVILNKINLQTILLAFPQHTNKNQHFQKSITQSQIQYNIKQIKSANEHKIQIQFVIKSPYVQTITQSICLPQIKQLNCLQIQDIESRVLQYSVTSLIQQNSLSPPVTYIYQKLDQQMFNIQNVNYEQQYHRLMQIDKVPNGRYIITISFILKIQSLNGIQLFYGDGSRRFDRKVLIQHNLAKNWIAINMRLIYQFDQTRTKFLLMSYLPMQYPYKIMNMIVTLKKETDLNKFQIRDNEGQVFLNYVRKVHKK